MIKIPSEILTVDEIVNATGKKASDIDIEIIGFSYGRKSMVLIVDTKLNFVMSSSLKLLMKERIRDRLGSAYKVRINYIYTGINIPQNDEPENSNNWYDGHSDKNGYRRASKDKPAFTNDRGELVIIGKDFNNQPVSYEEALNFIGSKDKTVIEGEVFRIDSRPIKSGKVLFIMRIANKIKTFLIKAFISNKKMQEIEENIFYGDAIRVIGKVEYDTFDHENCMMATAIKKINKEVKEDTYPGMKRVELHCHSKMSDNDGFNEVENIVTTAAQWNQTAVAITDHGVVQGFPDAAKTVDKLAKQGKKIKVIYGLEGYLYPDEDALSSNGDIDIKKNKTYHIILLAKNQVGLKNLYKLVSLSHIDYFYKKPRIPRSKLEEHREGIIVGSACEAGEVYQAIVKGETDDEIDRIASFYDYLEIQPLGNNQFMVNDGLVDSVEDIIAYNKKVIETGDRLGKLTVATTDSHYPNREASIYRNIIMAGIGFKDTASDSMYLRTTEEMMDEFGYLGSRAEEVVITNTNKIADMIETVHPIPKGKFPPKIEGADERLRESCYSRAKSIYGEILPDDIEERLETELNSIIGNGYAVMYIAAQMLVHKSNEDGYLVGSRGSVGSSFAATMAGITEVNPLPPHYICPKCKHYEKSNELDKYDTGYDMPDKACPECGTRMNKEGVNIPFATFLGFKGDKEPDIDLNFAGEYQSIAHKYVGEIFGEKNVFKAGTVATIADKTAFGYVKHYLEDNKIDIGNGDIDYLVKGCTGVKRTTGQHPGGIIVLPDDHEIYEFCPIQRPANKKDTDVITTHFDYHKLDENLLKLDVLGHDVPQLIRHLQVMTGVDPMEIPLDDKKTLSIFTSIDELKIKNPSYKFVHGTYAIPEFGTNFTRAMLDDINPTTVSALIKMSGFSHGTDVWTNNAQDLIRNKTATMNEVISCRDDIMNYLIAKGLNNSDAFNIMEVVRKNKVLTDEQLNLMKSHGVPDWYIKSCETLKYMFPRAHAAAYVMMSIRMAWFKVNYPEAFYAAWFSSKVDNFDADIIGKGISEVERKMTEIEDLDKAATAKQKEALTVYEVMYEMLSRGYDFIEPVLGTASSNKFTLVNGKLMLPFNAINGIGDSAAESLIEAYDQKAFTTVDDVRSRTKLSNSNIEDLKGHGLFTGLPESAQISIFDM